MAKRSYNKDKSQPAYNYSRHYQRHLGGVAGSLDKRKIPPSVELLKLRQIMTVIEIAAKFGCSANCVYDWIRRAKGIISLIAPKTLPGLSQAGIKTI